MNSNEHNGKADNSETQVVDLPVSLATRKSRFSGAVILIMGLALAGWVFELAFLQRFGPSPVAINPITAAAFFLTAVSIAVCLDSRKRTNELANANAALEKAREELEERVRQRTNSLADSNRRLEAAISAKQLILDNSRDVICTVDKDGCFVTVSAASETIWGYKPVELVGQQYIGLVHLEDRAKTNQAAMEVMAGSATTDFENRYIRKDGSLVNMMWSAYWSENDQIMFAVAHDITQRALIEKALTQAKEEAERADLAKSEFLSRMSHELRTPMNAILGFAQLLEMDELNPEQKEGVDHIIRGGRHLLELINEVLDLARIEAGRMSLSPEPVDLAEILHETIELVRPLATDREVELIAPSATNSYVLADRQRLKQVLINLVSNSIKYNCPGGSVAITCESNERCTRIFVRDTGIGIHPDRLGRLFTPFERLGAEHGDIEGTGLGLAVAKRLTEAMEGTIGVESVLGEGSAFWIELPVTESPQAVLDLVDDALEGPPVDSTATYTVLNIEDNRPNFELIERVLLRRPRIELLAARTGTEGLAIARERIPDLILLDFNLPDIDGYQVLASLKSDPCCASIPVIMVSADATSRQKDRLLMAGAVEYLTKPLNIKKFLAVVDLTLAERARERDQYLSVPS